MPLLFPSASPYPSPEEVWTTAFNELEQRLGHYFVRQLQLITFSCNRELLAGHLQKC